MRGNKEKNGLCHLLKSCIRSRVVLSHGLVVAVASSESLQSR